jgi:hypothetical protein
MVGWQPADRCSAVSGGHTHASSCMQGRAGQHSAARRQQASCQQGSAHSSAAHTHARTHPGSGSAAGPPGRQPVLVRHPTALQPPPAYQGWPPPPPAGAAAAGCAAAGRPASPPPPLRCAPPIGWAPSASSAPAPHPPTCTRQGGERGLAWVGGDRVAAGWAAADWRQRQPLLLPAYARAGPWRSRQLSVPAAAQGGPLYHLSNCSLNSMPQHVGRNWPAGPPYDSTVCHSIPSCSN